ncbi:MAG: ATP-binding protein [Desulfuromonadaceae bacterium]|nr:ATP-binding protein [Desulfuromonadaceae bacterium]
MIQQQKKLLLTQKYEEISTIADLKTSQIVQWRKERFAEGASIRANAMMARRINDYIADKSKNIILQECKLWLSSLVDLGEYSNGVIFSPDGEIITSDSEIPLPLSQHYQQLVTEAATEQELILSNFHRDNGIGTYNINLAIPIMQADRCIAVLVLDIDPAKRLYPLVKSWPTASSSAETLLVMREGDSVLFLNSLRYRTNTTTPYLLPLTNHAVPAVRVALGQEGSFEGIDYRNTKVLATTRIVPGTRWGVVTKIDVSEVMAPLLKTTLMVSFAGVVLIFTEILGIFLLGTRRKAEMLRKMVTIEQQHNLELKKSEDALIQSRDYHMKLLEIFPSLVWRSDINAHCDYFNQTWLAFTGRSLAQELDDGWMDGVHPEDLERCVTTYREAFSIQQAFNMEYRLRFNDGSYHWINDHGCPYYDLNGAFAGYIGSCYDITVQKNAESELQGIHAHLERQITERTADLSEINLLLRQEIAERETLEQRLLNAKRLEAIGQIAGGVAHEVRNPLNAILTITEALFRENEIASNPELEPFIQHIRTQVNRLAQLMNDLLDLGRTIPAACLQPVPLTQVCCEALDLWKSTGTSNNKQGILTSDDDGKPILVLADGLKLQQVFFNLLENAGSHTPDSSKIMVRLNHDGLDSVRAMAVVQVIDQGTGIPEEKLSHVFEPFYTDRKGGTGLGLALVKHFIENMGGTVQIWNNSPPPGCTVEICIPLYQEESN